MFLFIKVTREPKGVVVSCGGVDLGQVFFNGHEHFFLGSSC